MSKREWLKMVGLLTAVVLGVSLSKVVDHWVLPVRAVAGNEGKRIATEQAETFRRAAKTIAPSVVSIVTLERVRYADHGGLSLDGFGMPFYKAPSVREGLTPQGLGSGFVFDSKNGYVMTNAHVVSDGTAWVVRLPDKRELEAHLVGTDPRTDIAVLQINARSLVAAGFGDSSKLEVGDWVLACGDPFGFLEQTVTAGIISAKGRQLGISNYEDYLQTDAAINVGNSGGPLVDLDGNVIGINTAILSRSGGYQGVGFAIPINPARKVAEKLIAHGAVVRGWMGVEAKDLTPAEARTLNVAGGVTVTGIQKNGPALTAGLLPDDVLVSINGTPVKSAQELSTRIADVTPGTALKLTIRRREETKTISLTIGSQPKNLSE
ncbi:MAG TPA: trypsin-like peptidase domain-containing protein [Planctomycetota bacterium]|jgi:serine protease Do